MQSDKKTKLHVTSVRFEFEEVAKIDSDRGRVSRSDYIRHCVINPDKPLPKARGSNPIKSHQALAQVIAILGASRLKNNLNQIARALNMSEPLDEAMKADLQNAIWKIDEMYRANMEAVGRSVEP